MLSELWEEYILPCLAGGIIVGMILGLILLIFTGPQWVAFVLLGTVIGCMLVVLSWLIGGQILGRW